jgi:transcriptional regulator with XRE-family HTH domain
MKDQINKIMETEGLTPAKFADEIGVQRSSISHIISGRNKPSYDFIVKILSRFSGINADWLLTGKGNMIKSSGNTINAGIKQSSLFDLPEEGSIQKEKVSNDIVSKENKEHLKNSPGNQIIADANNEKAKEDKSVKNSQFTNVNKVKFILIFYEDGAFEQFMSRQSII